jgi:hypothetical protein
MQEEEARCRRRPTRRFVYYECDVIATVPSRVVASWETQRILIPPPIPLCSPIYSLTHAPPLAWGYSGL